MADVTVYNKSRVDTLLGAKSDSTHKHAAADTTSGVFAPERIGSGTAGAGKYVDGASGAWTALPASVQINDATASATATYSSQKINSEVSGRAPASHSHTAAEITSGVFARARLGTGTAAAGTYVDGATGAWTALPASSGPGVTMVDNGDGTVTLSSGA